MTIASLPANLQLRRTRAAGTRGHHRLDEYLPFPAKFPGASGLYTHAIGKLLHVCSKQKLGQCMIGSTGKGVS
jgi:hypothetical protein